LYFHFQENNNLVFGPEDRILYNYEVSDLIKAILDGNFQADTTFVLFDLERIQECCEVKRVQITKLLFKMN
jgi:hypothetical protein